MVVSNTSTQPFILRLSVTVILNAKELLLLMSFTSLLSFLTVIRVTYFITFLTRTALRTTQPRRMRKKDDTCHAYPFFSAR